MRKVFLAMMLAAATLLAAEDQTKVLHIKHRPAESLARLLPGHQMRINPSRDFNTITVSGPAENVKMAEAIIEQYDTPRRQAEFILRVIEASSTGQGPNDAADLVPAELKSLLRYNRYAQRDSAVLRGLESDPLRLELASNLMCRMSFRVRDTIELELLIQGPLQTIKDRTFNPELLATTTTVKNGETVVLGASKMQGGSSALIVLLTAKLLP